MFVEKKTDLVKSHELLGIICLLFVQGHEFDTLGRFSLVSEGGFECV